MRSIQPSFIWQFHKRKLDRFVIYHKSMKYAEVKINTRLTKQEQINRINRIVACLNLK